LYTLQAESQHTSLASSVAAGYRNERRNIGGELHQQAANQVSADPYEECFVEEGIKGSSDLLTCNTGNPSHQGAMTGAHGGEGQASIASEDH
jgi:hypothetical protein